MALAKVKGKHLCKKLDSAGDGSTNPFSAEKLEMANRAKQAALEILQDALEKKMYAGDPPAYFPSCTLDPDPLCYSTVLTKELLESMIKTMEKVEFLEDTDPSNDDCFAYVYPDLRHGYTVYLCKEFWSAEQQLARDSRPGTLIHEVSHFLGTEDITYDFVCTELHTHGERLMGTRVAYQDNQKTVLGSGDMSQNANSIEYEFEMILNHSRQYSEAEQKYPCCGESKINTVCKERETWHYKRGGLKAQ